MNATTLLALMVVATRVALQGVTEPLPWMSEAGALFYDIGLAWLTAWAFQYLVIVRPAEIERRRLNAVLAPRLDSLITLGLELDRAMRLQLQLPSAEFEVNAGRIERVCRDTRLTEPAPGWLGSWSGAIQQLSVLAQRARTNLKPFYGRLPPDLLEALEAEEEAMNQLSKAERFSSATEASDMTRLETPMKRWLTSINMLRSLRVNGIAPDRDLPSLTAVRAGILRVPDDEIIERQEEFHRKYRVERRDL